jgi:hypothetical protein
MAVLHLIPLKETGARLEKRLSEIEKQVYEAVGKTFNINSTQQLSDVLFNRLGLEPPDRGNKTASGHFSTSAGVLDLLRGKHPVVDWVLEHRTLLSHLCDALQARSTQKRAVCTILQSDESKPALVTSIEPAEHPIRSKARLRQGFMRATCCSPQIIHRWSCGSLAWLKMAGPAFERMKTSTATTGGYLIAPGSDQYASACRKHQLAHLWNVCFD